MKKFLFNMILACVMCLGFASCGYERVDAGCEGILVNLYGDDKGVGDVSLCTGAVWYNPIAQDVFEYPTFVQTVDYAPFEVNSKDGTKFTVDPSVLVKIEDGKSPIIFKKYRRALSDVILHFMFTSVMLLVLSLISILLTRLYQTEKLLTSHSKSVSAKHLRLSISFLSS